MTVLRRYEEVAAAESPPPGYQLFSVPEVPGAVHMSSVEIGTLSDGRPVMARTAAYKTPIQVLDNDHLPTLFKVLSNSASSRFGGDLTWPLPTEDGPGGWVEVLEEPLIACNWGLHFAVVDSVREFTSRFGVDGGRVFVAEADGPAIVHATDKVVVARARLVREITDPSGMPAKVAEPAVWAARYKVLDEIAEPYLERLIRIGLERERRRYFKEGRPIVKEVWAPVVKILDATDTTAIVKSSKLIYLASCYASLDRYEASILKVRGQLPELGLPPTSAEHLRRQSYGRASRVIRNAIGQYNSHITEMASRIVGFMPKRAQSEWNRRLTAGAEERIEPMLAGERAEYAAYLASVTAIYDRIEAAATKETDQR